ncbi:TetR/AcrR family transcriptional regulator, partial [Clostridioides difficile]|uniref:TetR/AcrR family transcriptional regulator n=1 Tax=Clostridioides difficile TaxID=1496 RepID=UPI003F8D7097
ELDDFHKIKSIYEFVQNDILFGYNASDMLSATHVLNDGMGQWLNLLNEVDDIEEITVRKIAERANVGVGLINYHFKTKDNLLST